jgi:hypothetical protein
MQIAPIFMNSAPQPTADPYALFLRPRSRVTRSTVTSELRTPEMRLARIGPIRRSHHKRPAENDPLTYHRSEDLPEVLSARRDRSAGLLNGTNRTLDIQYGTT